MAGGGNGNSAVKGPNSCDCTHTKTLAYFIDPEISRGPARDGASLCASMNRELGARRPSICDFTYPANLSNEKSSKEEESLN